MEKVFQNLLLLGRPASGKSEFIDFMKNVPDETSASRYHIGKFQELDDFPWIWQKFMEDDIWEKAGQPRRFSFGGENPGLVKKGEGLFDFCIHKINAEYEKYKGDGTLIVEFSRGGENGYQNAFNRLSPEILKKAAVLFIDVSFEESCRRNEARYREKQKHSILAHKVPDETMQTFYRVHDWKKLTGGQENGFLKLEATKIPFVTMNNEPELTDPLLLDARYHEALHRLMELRNDTV